MEKFDLLKAEKGIPIKTRNGIPAKFICVLRGGQPAPLLVGFKSGLLLDIIRMENYYLNGRFGLHDSDMDLFMDTL